MRGDFMKYKDIISRLTLEEKAALCSGKDFWHLVGVERLGIPSIMVTDGPHGLRKKNENKKTSDDMTLLCAQIKSVQLNKNMGIITTKG